MIGTKLSHYEILATLGAGGMGVVYKARDTRLNRLAAVKTLKSATADEDRRRFAQEAKAASALNHPGIITIYDIARDGEVDFIAMEYVEGRTLEELIARKAIPLAEALDYAIQTARALTKAHSAGIIHRDLKPSNIMVTSDGLVKILDFGVAKLIGLAGGADDSNPATVTRTASMDAALTNARRLVGTIAFMSPEQASGQQVDARSDIFSFGCVLYEMLTGTRAFPGDSPISTLAAIVNQEPTPAAEINAQIPRDLERIIVRCLRKDPARRFQHLDDVAVELEEVRVESGTQASPAVSPVGSLLAYTWCQKGCDIYVQELGPSLVPRGEPRRLTNQAGPLTYGLTWAADGKSVVYGSYIGSFNVWRVSISDPKPEPMELGIGAMRPAIARQGNRLAFVGIGTDSDIWKFEAGVGPTPVVSSNHFDLDPQLSPDGRRIALASERSGKGREIWTANVDGSGAVRLTDASGKLHGTPRWSPDGRWIAYDALEESGEYGIYVIDAAGGSARPVTAPGAVPSWSRDGKWIYFRSSRSGRHEIWRLPATGGTPEQVTKTGGIAAWESWDGTELYYSRGGALYSQPLAGGPERQVLASLMDREFFPTKNGIFYVIRPDAKRRAHEIRYLAFTTGRSETLYRFDSLALTQGLSVTLDEKTIILCGVSPSKNADLMLIQNFR